MINLLDVVYFATFRAPNQQQAHLLRIEIRKLIDEVVSNVANRDREKLPNYQEALVRIPTRKSSTFYES